MTDEDKLYRLPVTHLTVPEAAAALKLSERTVWELIRTEELESFKMRGRRFVPVEAIERFLEAERAAWAQRRRPPGDDQ